jgi:hypothetical protein
MKVMLSTADKALLKIEEELYTEKEKFGAHTKFANDEISKLQGLFFYSESVKQQLIPQQQI